MRLHSLSLTAFGPFADTVEVDLDDVGRDGLFLLWGPTGAGKTTLLDGVVFALYGTVPGARRAPEQEQAVTADLVQVDLRGVGERPEGGERQGVQPHEASSAAAAATSARCRSARSASAAGTPRTCATNSAATSRSLRPRSRSR